VRFAFDLFRGMQPGIPLVALHGKIKQERRTLIYMDFIRRKSACMFATDIASRGLDFPDIDWVVQVDAPEDTNMYIHRVGRTARYNANGRALLLLLPSEEAPVSRNLSEAGVPIKRLTVNPNQTVSVGTVAASFLAQHPDCRILAKKAFVSYIRSLQLTPGQQAGADLSNLPLDDFAASLGLPFTPEVPAVAGTAGREEVREKKNVNRSLDKLKKQIKAAKEEKRRAREAAARGEAPPPATESTAAADDNDEGDLFTVKRIHEWASTNTSNGASSSSSSSSSSSKIPDSSENAMDAWVDAGKLKKPKALKIKLDGTARVKQDTGVQKIVYDDEGNPVEQIKLVERPRGSAEGPGRQLIGVAAQVEERARRVRAALDQGRHADKQREADRIKEKRIQRKMKYLAEKDRKSGEPAVAVLGGGDGDDDGDDDDDDGERGAGRGRVVMSNDDDDDYDGNRRGGSKQYDDGDDDDDDDNDGDDDDDHRPGRRKRARSKENVFDEEEIRKQERLALKLLRTK
jgi:ATP-dependent RNA helicase DDX10/DBP4